MKFRLSVAVILLLGLIFSCKDSATLPKSWRSAWENPPASYRPLQIVHGADIRHKAAYYKDTCGLGGVVCNVAFGDRYLKSEEDWKVFTEGVKAMYDTGLRVWIYDEDGYPSLAAGGRVLEADPSLEALEMVYDKEDKQQPFKVRPCYEFVHASNNFYAARRYPNPLDPNATHKFIELTHQAYYKHLGPELYGKVEAFFTDEPSMMGCNLGQLREEVRKNVRVIDPVDPKKKNLPMISWANDLPEKYKARYGEDLMASIGSVFTGNDEKDKVVRQKFWSLLAETDKDNYYKAIQIWLKVTREAHHGKGPVSSGHGLREENPSSHVPLDGNKLEVSSGFDIPGLDQLSSDPSIWEDSSWMTTAFPGSSAYLNGQRRVMCEMSDFDQTINGKNPVDVQHMQVATAWQMAMGVTDFNLYYTPSYGKQFPYRQEAQYKEYCNFVGRVNALLMEAKPVRKTLLYYPIYDLQREFIPVAEKMSWRTQRELTKTIESSFRQLGANLLKAQTQFVLVDYLVLEKAKVNSNETIQVGANQCSAVVFPKGITLPASVSKIMEEAKSKGVKIVYANDYKESPMPEELAGLVGTDEKLIPSEESVAFGKFIRDGLDVYMMVNTGDKNYIGKLNVEKGKRYIQLDPQTGQLSEEQINADQLVSINLAPLQTRLYIIR
jgi:hypothetical protein